MYKSLRRIKSVETGTFLLGGLVAGVLLMVLPDTRAGAATVWLGYLQWIAGLTALSLFGGACRAAFRLPAAPQLNGFVNILYGQVVLLAYFYLRTIPARFLNAPGVHAFEFWLVVLLPALILLARRVHRVVPGIGSRRHRRALLASIAENTVLFLLLGTVFFAMAPRLGTPCSDTDVHAFLAGAVFKLGTFPSVSPLSDRVLLDYPGGFAALNTIYLHLTRLSPVQIVNLQPYFQWVLFLGAWMAVWPSRKVPRIVFLGMLMLVVAWGIGGFNPFFLSNRRFLGGTARLAHTALFFFPAIHLWLNRRPAAARRFGYGFFPPVGIAIGFCMSPAHLIPTTLATFAGWIVVRAWRKRERPGRGCSSRASRLGWSIGWLIAFAMIATDPACGALRPRGDNQDARRWSQHAVREDIARRPLFSIYSTSAARFAAARNWIARTVAKEQQLPSGLPSSPAIRRVFRVAHATTGLCVLLWAINTFRRTRQRGASWYATLFVFLLGTLLLVWTAVCAAAFNIYNLMGALGIAYASQAAAQAFWILIGYMAIYPVLMQYEDKTSRKTRSFFRGAAATWAVGGALLLLLPAQGACRVFRSGFGVEAAACIRPQHMAAYIWIGANVPKTDRILLPGTLYDGGWEFWVFPAGPAAGVGLYTTAQPAFFYGLCGFTAQDYEKHVANGLDLAWMKENRIFWVFDFDGNMAFSTETLAQHFDRVHEQGGIRIWRMR